MGPKLLRQATVNTIVASQSVDQVHKRVQHTAEGEQLSFSRVTSFGEPPGQKHQSSTARHRDLHVQNAQRELEASTVSQVTTNCVEQS